MSKHQNRLQMQHKDNRPLIESGRDEVAFYKNVWTNTDKSEVYQQGQRRRDEVWFQYYVPYAQALSEIKAAFVSICHVAVSDMGSNQRRIIKKGLGDLAKAMKDFQIVWGQWQQQSYLLLDPEKVQTVLELVSALDKYARAYLNSKKEYQSRLIALREFIQSTDYGLSAFDFKVGLRGSSRKDIIHNQWLFEYAGEYKKRTGRFWKDVANDLIKLKDTDEFTTEQLIQLSELAESSNPDTYLRQGLSEVKKRKPALIMSE